MKLTIGRSYPTDVKEPSGLAFLSPALGFVTIDDDAKKIIRLMLPRDPDGQVEHEEIDVGAHRHLLRGLEGIAYDAEAHSLLVIGEETRILSELALEPGRASLKLGDPVKRTTLKRVGQEKNGGWEGIALLAARLTPDNRTRLLAVNERDPRGLAVMDRRTLAMEIFMPLPPELAEGSQALIDLSDLTIDARSGHLFLLSDRSQTVVETAFDGKLVTAKDGSSSVTWSIRPLARTDLPDSTTKHRLQPEGLAFDDNGDLWVVSEGDGSLRVLGRD